jgi:hypothetical protein
MGSAAQGRRWFLVRRPVAFSVRCFGTVLVPRGLLTKTILMMPPIFRSSASQKPRPPPPGFLRPNAWQPRTKSGARQRSGPASPSPGRPAHPQRRREAQHFRPHFDAPGAIGEGAMRTQDRSCRCDHHQSAVFDQRTPLRRVIGSNPRSGSSSGCSGLRRCAIAG